MPFRYEDIVGRIDFDEAAPWHGPPPAIPRIEPNQAPEGLVFVVHRDGTEVDRVPVVPGGADPAEVALRHGEMVRCDASLRVLIFDGDTGKAVAAVGR